MKVISNKILLLIFVCIGCCGLIFLYNFYDKNNIVLPEVKLMDLDNKEMFAIMLEQNDGTYKEEENNNWPTGEYIYDIKRSGCIDSNGNKIDGALKYNNNERIASVDTSKTSFCYLYFNKRNDISISVNYNGNSGIMPSNLKYKTTISCEDNGIANWNSKYDRFEIGANGSSNCQLNFSDDGKQHQTLVEVVQNSTSVVNNGNRYNGKTPNNYIWFNNDLWRIIGYLPVTLSNGQSGNLVKIIKANSLGRLSYDTSNHTNKWEESSLYKHLNTYYYASTKDGLNGQNSPGCFGGEGNSQSNCDYRETGILSTSYYGQMVEEVYWNSGLSEMSSTAADIYTSEIATKSTKGYIGVMNASDYGYATSSDYYYFSLSHYATSNLVKNNWLFYGEYELTLGCYNNDLSFENIYITQTGSVSTRKVNYGYAVRPVVYLKNSVVVLSGDGTEANPYKIAM